MAIKRKTKITEPKVVGTVTFSIKNDGTMDVNVVTDVAVKDYAQLCGSLMHDINSGYFENILLQRLVESSQVSVEHRDFMIDVIQAWKTANSLEEELRREERLQELPLVRPLRTFGGSRL
jgi:hypothetical protein